MSIISKIIEWRYKFLDRHFDVKFTPLTRDEILEIRTSAHAFNRQSGESEPRIMGTPIFESEYAPQMREVMLRATPWVRELTITEAEYKSNTHRAERHLKMSLERSICHDTTEIEVTLEWDPLARLKRALRITRWFPVKKRKVKIQGTVLYPYLDISLPNNRHHVRFALSQ